MQTKFTWIEALVVAAALTAATGPARAALTVYTTQATFLAAVQAPGVDTFSDLSVSEVTPGPLARSAGPYSYTASAPDGLFGAGLSSDPWLSSNTFSDAITLTGFGANVRGAGAVFFGSDVDGAFKAGTLTVVATDSLGATANRTFVGGLTGFMGFTTTGTLVSVVVTAVQSNDEFLWPTLDNLTVATVVPEPSPIVLLLAGLVGVAWLRNRALSAS